MTEDKKADEETEKLRKFQLSSLNPQERIDYCHLIEKLGTRYLWNAKDSMCLYVSAQLWLVGEKKGLLLVTHKIWGLKFMAFCACEKFFECSIVIMRAISFATKSNGFVFW